MADAADMPDDAIYEGKAKYLLRREDEPERLIQRFKDDATAFNGEKFAQFEGKGRLNCAISSHLFEILDDAGIPTHFQGRISDTEMAIERLEIVPLEVVVRNRVAGSLKDRTGLEEGTVVEPPVVETYFKRDDLGDPILTDDHIRLLDLAEPSRLDEMKRLAREINDVLEPVFADTEVLLIDFKLEFGVDAEGNLKLGDEISPDTSRLWKRGSNRILDKDVFRHDLGDLIDAYEQVADRLGVEVEFETRL